ncbi:MAG: Gfo/Idh/MocA family oxidoreductase [Caldilineaceae bacterium]|nr:Gfo/Idh/MocA family oxidoreductase [Caldilineaceae bacterium]
MLRVGIIGTGRISDLHALEYLQNDRAQITAVCDIDAESAQRRAAAWNVPAARVFTNHHDLLAQPDLDLVEVLLPHHLHHPVTLDALASGKHVSVQKPMALSLAQADEMIAAAAAADHTIRVYENFIFYPPVVHAKELIDAGEIGDPLTIRIKSNAGFSPTAWHVPLSAWAWRFDPAICGGGPLLFDDGHHKFALAWHFMELAEEVHAWIGQMELMPGRVLDTPAIVSWKFPANRLGSLEVVYSPQLQIETSYYAQDDRVEITGTKGVVWINGGHGRLTDAPPVTLSRDGQTRTFDDIPAGWEQSFIHATRHLIDALHDGGPPSLTGAEGRTILCSLLAAQESASTGQPVRV